MKLGDSGSRKPENVNTWFECCCVAGPKNRHQPKYSKQKPKSNVRHTLGTRGQSNHVVASKKKLASKRKTWLWDRTPAKKTQIPTVRVERNRDLRLIILLVMLETYQSNKNTFPRSRGGGSEAPRDVFGLIWAPC